MAVTYRVAKGSPLTHAEFDANMLEVETTRQLAETAVEAAAVATAVVGSTVWAVDVEYTAGDVVHDPGDHYRAYVAQTTTEGDTPYSDDGTNWVPILVPYLEVYDDAKVYKVGDIVLDTDDSYMAYVSQTNSNEDNTPNEDDGTNWVRIYNDPYTPEVTQALGSLSDDTEIDIADGQIATLTIADDLTLTITGWLASGKYSELLLVMTNGGAHTITWPTINWLLSSGAFTTTFSSNEAALQSSGIDFIFLWTINGGTTIYGKIVR
jgi:hypothetical protein